MAETEVCSTTESAGATSNCVLLDELGQPVSERIAQALHRLAPAFSRQFADFRDQSLLVESLERAAYRIRRRETRDGPVDDLDAYAWVTLVSIANSLLRRGNSRLARKTTAEFGQSVLNLAATTLGTVEQIERGILIRELLDRLSPVERGICEAKLEGLSSQEIADRRGCTAGAIDVLLTRIRGKLRLAANERPDPQPGRRNPTRQRSARRARHRRGALVAALARPTRPEESLQL